MKGKLTVHVINTVINFVHQTKQLELKYCLLALDIASAFDNAWHSSLLHRLWNQNCPPNIYNIIKNFLEDHSAHFSLDSTSCTKLSSKVGPKVQKKALPYGTLSPEVHLKSSLAYQTSRS